MVSEIAINSLNNILEILLMKTIYLVLGLTVLFLSTSLHSQTANDLDRIGSINGKVKSIKENHFTVLVNFGDYEPNKMLYRIDYNLDISKNIKTILFIPENISFTSQFLFGDNGLIERYNSSFIDQTPNNFTIYEYENNLLKSMKFYADYAVRMNEPSFQPKKNIIELMENKFLVEHLSISYNGNLILLI